MNPSDLEHLARQGYTRVPLVRRLLADLDTPLGAYLRFAGPFSFLFESVEGGEKWGRYSIIGLPCRRRIVVRGREITLCDGDEQRSFTHADPLAFIEQTIALERVYEHPDLPMFSGGLVGYFGYDCVRLVEPRLAAGMPPDALGTPDILLLDEPSNHLDPAHQQALQQQLRHWQQQGPRAALVVLHDLNLALRLASHALLLLPDGQWLAGPVPEVIHAQSLQQCLNQAFAPVQHAGRTWWLAQE